jgi:acetyltransferase
MHEPSEVVTSIVGGAGKTGRTVLTEHESKEFLRAYAIPCTQSWVAIDEEQAVRAAEQIGYPVVLKLHSETITHKSDVAGVKLNLADGRAVRSAYQQIQASVPDAAVTVQPMIDTSGAVELILGSTTDAQFGPVLLFGLGGRLVEVIQDRALALPPLTTTLARRLMEQTKAYTALRGLRGAEPADVAALERLVVRFSQLVVEQPRIREIEINPLLVRGSQLIALDARAMLYDSKTPKAALPRPAIRPYPKQYVSAWTMHDGTAITIRPIRPEDEPHMVQFHGALSEETVHARYGGLLKLGYRVSHERLARMCFTDYDRQIALVADHTTESGGHQILAVARLIKEHGASEAEFAVVVADRWQKQGLGCRLLELLIEIARAERLERIIGQIAAEANAMKRLCERSGFRLSREEGATEWRAELTL